MREGDPRLALFKAEGVVLRTRDLGEADKILTLYTRENGKIHAVARGCRRARSRLLAVSQVFAHSRFLLFEGRGLHNVSQGELINSFRPLREDLERVAYASYAAELVDAFVAENEPSEPLFRLVLEGFTLVAGTGDLDLSMRWFELKLMERLGYRPEFGQCVSCAAPPEGECVYDAAQGGVLCASCRGTAEAGTVIPLTPGVLAQLRRLLETPAPRLGILRPSRADRLLMERVVRAHIDHRLDRPIKSREFLEAMRSLGGEPAAGVKGERESWMP